MALIQYGYALFHVEDNQLIREYRWPLGADGWPIPQPVPAPIVTPAPPTPTQLPEVAEGTTDHNSYGVVVDDPFDGGAYVLHAIMEEPPTVVVLPAQVERRQFYHQLALDHHITRHEARAAMSGLIPGFIERRIKELPHDEQFAQEMIFAGGDYIPRSNQPTISQWVVDDHLTQAQVDAFFLAASKL